MLPHLTLNPQRSRHRGCIPNPGRSAPPAVEIQRSRSMARRSPFLRFRACPDCHFAGGLPQVPANPLGPSSGRNSRWTRGLVKEKVFGKTPVRRPVDACHSGIHEIFFLFGEVGSAFRTGIAAKDDICPVRGGRVNLARRGPSRLSRGRSGGVELFVKTFTE